jgi:tetratricopeptide (TPR) repeat protein
MNLEQFEEALADLDRCFELLGGPRAPGLHGRLMQATALSRLGREEEALEMVDLAIANYPDNDAPLRHRSALSLQLGRIEESLDYAEQAIKLVPKNAMNYLMRAQALIHSDDSCDRVMTDLETADELSPDDPAIALVRAVVQIGLHWQCRENRDPEQALALAGAAVKNMPGDAYRQYVHGMALYRVGRYREARAALQRAAELYTPKPEAETLFALAMTEWKLGNRADARSFYDRAAIRMNETYPRDPWKIIIKKEAAEVLGIED